MKVPLSWLKDYVDIEEDVDQLRDLLTFSGLEVEAVEKVADFEGVIVAQIIDTAPHPNADRLRLCKVQTGSEVVDVVCGAANARPGLMTAFGPVGAVLPGGFKLKKAKIRGEHSFGMLCAEDELGLGEGHDGILELDSDYTPGTPLHDVVGPPDVVFDLEVTPNRPDCLCIVGVARELAALTGRPLRMPDADYEDYGEPAEQEAGIEVRDTGACPRYTAHLARDIQVGPAPDWMRRRLHRCGIRPINNVVDITNYVLLELGQPLHAFDQDRLGGNQIVVRRAEDGEILTTLDGDERALEPHHLVIADVDTPVALAGVMGGANSEIDHGTSMVLLESAWFDPALVRATSKEFGLVTESSYRFARGVDLGGVAFAGQRAMHLLATHANAQPLQGRLEVFPDEPKPRKLDGRWQKVNALIGIDIPQERVQALLEGLGLTWLEADPEGFTVEIPSWRGDLEREVDLIEEIARLNGLDQIPSPAPRAQIVPDAAHPSYAAQRALREQLVGLGLRGIMNYSLTTPELLETLDPEHVAEQIVLPNPISRDQAVLRTSLLPQMLETLGRNRAHQVDTCALFELDKIYRNTGDEERLHLAMGLYGPFGRTYLERNSAPDEQETYLRLKGLVEKVLRTAELPVSFVSAERKIFAPGRAAEVRMGDEVIGVIGLVDEAYRHPHRLNEPVALAELALAPLLERHGKIQVMKPIPTHPSVSRDAALIVSEDTLHADIEQVIRGAGPTELESVHLFDIFTGDRLGKDRKSLAYRTIFRAADRTLTDAEVNGFQESIRAALAKKVGAEFS